MQEFKESPARAELSGVLLENKDSDLHLQSDSLPPRAAIRPVLIPC